MRRLRPSAPFVDHEGHKGLWERLSKAQKHDVLEFDISLGNLMGTSRSLGIAVLSDVHMGSHTDDLNRLQTIVDEINAWECDLVLLPGDFMNTQILGGGRVPPQVTAEILAKLQPKIGCFAVLGNHDWHYDGHSVWRALEDVGITVLENASVQLPEEHTDIWIVGLADHQTRIPDWRRAISNVPKNVAKLVLAHDPASFALLPDQDLLAVCGHTHGGQIVLPGVGPLTNSSSAPMRWTSGYVLEGQKQMLVSRGIGTSILPIRIGCKPDVLRVTLTGSLQEEK